MALKDLLVHVDRTPEAQLRLRMAADLCRRHASLLGVLQTREPGAAQIHEESTGELGLVSAAELNREDQRASRANTEDAQKLEREVAAIGREFGVTTQFHCREGTASVLVPQYARFADLCLLGRDLAQKVLVSAGRPLIIIPSLGGVQPLGRHIVVAWNSSKASARALSDALPLIESADRVTVLAINPDHYQHQYNALPPRRMVEHLKRHNANVDERLLDGVDEARIGATIQEGARQVGADLIVAGAFGHPTLWEKLMGGTTQALLAQMTVPTLMSF